MAVRTIRREKIIMKIGWSNYYR